jgi:hypothetical protein
MEHTEHTEHTEYMAHRKAHQGICKYIYETGRRSDGTGAPLNKKIVNEGFRVVFLGCN